MAAHKLFDAQDEDATSAAYGTVGPTRTVHVSGGFDSGTCTIEASTDGGTTYTSIGSDGEFTAAGWVNINIVGSFHVRAVLASTAADAATLTVEVN